MEPGARRMADLCWVDGRLAPTGEPLLPADDSGFLEARACYATARWTGRDVRHAARQVARLRRDARAIGVGDPDPEHCLRAFRELGRAVFDTAQGVIRLQASRDASGGIHLVALARALGPEPAAWRAVSLPFPHPGVAPWRGAKVTSRLLHALGADAVREAGADEGLLFDATDRLVEGTRSNLVAVGPDGVPRVPPAGRGAVAGVALEIAREAVPEIEEADVPRRALGALRELVALNAVRGAVPVTERDGVVVGDGAPGPVAARLARALAEAG